jgi:hypothetical protein
VVEEFQESQMDELLAFLTKWSPDHPELGEGDIIRWQKCYRFVSKSRGKIVGYIAQIPHEFRYGKKSRPPAQAGALSGNREGTEHIGWGITLVVDGFEDSPHPSRLRTAYVHELLSRIENNPPWQFGAVGVVPEIEEPYRRRGHAVRRDCSKMYARFLYPAKALKYVGRSSVYAPAIFLVNVFLRAQKSVRYGKVEKIKQFKPAWDEKWDELMSEQYELYGVRDAEYLNYKLTQPNRDYHVYVHFDEAKNTIDGYIVFRHATHRARDLNLVKVCDMVGTERAKADLVSLAVKFVYERRAYGVVALGSNNEEKVYKKAGLYIAKPYPVTMPSHITAKMHVSFFDSDLDNLW